MQNWWRVLNKRPTMKQVATQDCSTHMFALHGMITFDIADHTEIVNIINNANDLSFVKKWEISIAAIVGKNITREF